MIWTICAKRGALCAALLLMLTAAKCDKDGIAYKVEELPAEFRHCASVQRVNVRDYETDGKILWKDAQRLLVDMTANRNGLERCHASTVKWIDAQHAALNRYLGK